MITYKTEHNARIRYLRKLLIVHSYLYYHVGTSVMDDHKWQALADELTHLQEQHGHLHGYYDAEFMDWTGATGMHLPTKDPWIACLGLYLTRLTGINT